MRFNLDKNEFVVSIFFFLISLCKGLGLSNGSKIYLILYVLGLIIASLKIFRIKMSTNEFITVLIIICLGVLDYIFGSESTILFTGLSLFFLKNSNITNIIKMIFWGRIIGFALMILLPIMGIIDMNTLPFYRNGETIIRYCFGYTHPNLAHSSFVLITIMYTYLYFDKISLKNLVLFEILNIVLYNFTFSRTGFYICTLFLLLTLIMKKSKKAKDTVPKILNFVLITVLLLSISSAFLYGKVPIINKIDLELTGRIRYINYIINNYTLPLIKITDYSNVIFDNGYFDLFYNGGVLATIWFIILQIKTNMFIKQKKLYKEGLVTLIFLIYSITESYYASSIMNVSLLFFCYIIYKNKSNQFNKGELLDVKE